MMLTATQGLPQLRQQFDDSETRDLLRVLLNSRSAAEASFALSLLEGRIPEKALVSAVNLREVLSDIPASPFAMRVDEDTLVRTCALTKGTATLSRVLDDGIELAITTAGNLVLDIIVRVDGDKYFWSPMPSKEDFVTPKIVDLVVDSACLLEAVIDLVTSMGMVFNPKFYLSLEDWHLEYAGEAMELLGDLFKPAVDGDWLNW